MTVELKAADGGVVQVSPEILQAFKAGFAGTVLGPDDAAYDDTRQIWNAMIDRRPSDSGNRELARVNSRNAPIEETRFGLFRM